MAERPSKNAMVTVAALTLSVGYILVTLALGGPQLSGPSILVAIVVMTLASLVLVPLCARLYRSAFLLSVVVGVVVLIGSAFGVATLASRGPEATIGPLVWLVLQVPIILFGLRAFRKLSR